jgi:hypothetical protein
MSIDGARKLFAKPSGCLNCEYAICDECDVEHQAMLLYGRNVPVGPRWDQLTSVTKSTWHEDVRKRRDDDAAMASMLA